MTHTQAALPARRKSARFGGVAAIALLTSALLATPPQTRAEIMTGNGLNVYGLPGAIDTPSAEMLPDGTLAMQLSRSELARRQGFSFQFMPRALVTLRYGRAEGYDGRRGYVRDRSFDLRWQIIGEDGWRPAIAIGLQDFIGTGLYGAEYVVATKTLTPRLRASLGLGWGRLASTGSIGTPFGTREPSDYGPGGKLTSSQWFRGPVAPFASVSWQATDRWRLIAEYSGDDYAGDIQEGRRVGKDWDDLSTQLNFGAQYISASGYSMGVHLLGGKVLGAQFSMALNPRKAAYPSGLEGAPAPVRPRPASADDPQGWSGEWAADPTAQPAIQTALAKALNDEGQMLEAMTLSPTRAEVRIRNTRYIQRAEAVGRTARLMTRALPPSVETFVITLSENGLPVSSVTLRRTDIETHENTASATIAGLAVIDNAAPYPQGMVATPDLFPRLTWKFGPYFSLSSFDPGKPLRHEAGLEASARYEVIPGLVFAGTVRQRVLGNNERRPPRRTDSGVAPYTVDSYAALSDAQAQAENLGVPRVRTDSNMYSVDDRPRIPELTVNWYAHPTTDIYTRLTAGLLENAFAGVSGEVLWYPSNSRLALGAEVARVRKRDFEKPFALRDFTTTTGHVSAYYDFGAGYTGKVHVGRYLAQDKGVTVEVDRRFANGWVVGAFATKTDMPEDKFGESSFDKGVTLSLPLSWAIGTPSMRRVDTSLRSPTRDGGARLSVKGRLYETIRPAQKVDLYSGWGSFWR